MMIRRKILLPALTMIAFLLFTSCSPGTAPRMSPAETSLSSDSQKPAPIAAVKETWEEEWDKVVASAKKEGKIVLYGQLSGQTRMSVEQNFSQRYGMRMEIVTARASEITARIMSERKAGLSVVDIFLSGPTEMATILRPAGVLEPLDSILILPEVKDPKFWEGGELPFLDPEHTIFTFQAYPSGGVAVNTNMVKKEEIRSARDLLNPKWKGKILLADITTGPGSTFTTVVGAHGLGWSYLRELAKQEPLILKDDRLMVEWVAQGKFAILIAPLTDVFNEFERAGTPIELVMLPDAAYTTGGVGSVTLIKNAPHPNVSRLFINWLLSKEGITIYSKAQGNHSMRKDVPTDFLNPLRIRDPKVKYFNSDTIEYRLKKPEYIKLALEIFGNLMK